MSRRSIRVQKTACLTVESEYDDDEDAEFMSDIEPEKPQRKKRKTGGNKGKAKADNQPVKKLRGKRGLLKQLTEMPLDILYEIFSQLHPLDVLHLARTTKALRIILMSRSAGTIWKESRKQLVGFPPCPPDMSEPGYINLMFETHCHRCLARNTQAISWGLRKRFCQACIDQEFLRDFNYTVDYVMPSEAKQWFPKITGLVAFRRRGRVSAEFYHRQTGFDWTREYKGLGLEARKLWIEEKKSTYESINEHAQLCSNWLAGCASDRANELDRVREKRERDIIERLMALGWGEEIQKMDVGRLSRHKHVNQKKELTERIWNNIQPELIGLMENVKAKRIEEAQSSMLKRRVPLLKKIRQVYELSCPPNSIIPPAADLYLFQPFRDIIENTPFLEEITLENFAEPMKQLPDFVREWRTTKDQELAEMVCKARVARNSATKAPVSLIADSDAKNGLDTAELLESKSEADDHCLDLATTFFTCTGEYETSFVSYPRVLTHSDASATSTTSRNLATKLSDSKMITIFSLLQQSTWNGIEQISFWDNGHMLAKELVTLSGLNPDTTTAAKMDELDPVFECIDCLSENEGRKLMTWRRAIIHGSDKYRTHQFKLVDEATRAKVYDRLQDALLCHRLNAHHPTMLCVHCRTTGNMIKLKQHMKDVHFNTRATHDDMVPYVDADQSPPVYCLPVDILKL